MQRRGTLVEQGAHATITFRRRYQHSPERIWEAISTPEGLGGWLMCKSVDLEPREGGRMDTDSGPVGYQSQGKVLTWDPLRVFEYEWNVGPAPELPLGERAIFRYEIIPGGETTELLVIYRRITRLSAKAFLPGLHAFLDRLEAQLDGRPLPDWMKRFEELFAEYPELSYSPTSEEQQ
jgi:uncharacterized protein YndB with AHSA1/START domain